MEKPEKLLEDGPEWIVGDGVLQWSNRETGECGTGDMYKTWVGPFCCEIDVIPGNVYAKIFRHETHECSDVTEALDWLRSRIIAHRDELNRVTGARLRWVFLYKMGHGDPVEGKDYVFRHITDDGGVFHTVRQYTRHLAYDLEILCHPDGTPAEIPPLPETK